MWDRFVDVITILWLGIFFTNIIEPDLIPAGIELGLLSVFIADLAIKARSEPNFSIFLRNRWVDILMVIPYFRIFRILKFIRLIRFLKMTRVFRVGRFPGLKVLEASRRKTARIVGRVRRKGR
ncbi:hypothetical protein MYX75_01120 [Acidobacteria bacterium AH-259-A15]|nr:hypothetical protein [Acidobacteria bacterium AH-259-A15]